ncbi:hypothetical protein MXMO3_01826 [Maritalea myrionectae]|uniref:Uncharacterized protein n=1 Tax=Maritalea myrionectae TaxID=454601 RepID=A0A2R4ME82_9HYPH|nr:hypothetical protein [Maritalea myrionectae]AVX04351.1 hypothetical protein MXMO3_01826 [Maritalea myrionectae]
MTKNFDFNTNFVSVDSQEKGAEFEVYSDAGEPTGMFITLAGPDSTRRKKTHARLKDFYLKFGISAQKDDPKGRKARRAAAAQGSKYTGDTSNELHAMQMEDAVAATISWRYPDGFEGPKCTAENAIVLYSKHPTLLEQVLDAADDLNRFMKS